MKVSVPNDFGNTSKKPILPLVSEPIKGIKKEDLAAVVSRSDPNDHNLTQVKFTFKGLDGDSKTSREILHWRRNVEQALTGLDLTTGTTQHHMAKQFVRGSALAGFTSATMVLMTGHKADATVHAEQLRDNHPALGAAAHDAGIFANLTMVQFHP